MNWLDVDILSDAGINWSDIDVLSDTGVNWSDRLVAAFAIEVAAEKHRSIPVVNACVHAYAGSSGTANRSSLRRSGSVRIVRNTFLPIGEAAR